MKKRVERNHRQPLMANMSIQYSYTLSSTLHDVLDHDLWYKPSVLFYDDFLNNIRIRLLKMEDAE